MLKRVGRALEERSNQIRIKSSIVLIVWNIQCQTLYGALRAVRMEFWDKFLSGHDSLVHSEVNTNVLRYLLNAVSKRRIVQFREEVAIKIFNYLSTYLRIYDIYK